MVSERTVLKNTMFSNTSEIPNFFFFVLPVTTLIPENMPQPASKGAGALVQRKQLLTGTCARDPIRSLLRRPTMTPA